MAGQFRLPGGGFVSSKGSGQYRVPGGGFINDAGSSGPPPPTYRRALLISSGAICEVTDAQVGQGRKPVVQLGGLTQERVASEGAPVVMVDGTLRTLLPSETLKL